MMENSNSGSGNAIREFEERNRRTQYENKVVSPYGTKSTISASPVRDDVPGISTASSQDSIHTDNSIASRRARIMALTAKSRAGRVKSPTSPKNDAVKPRKWGSPSPRPIPPPVNRPPANPMEDYDGKEQSSCVESSSPPPSPPETLNPTSEGTEVEPVNKFKSWGDRDRKASSVVAYPTNSPWKTRAESPSPGQPPKSPRFVVPKSPTTTPRSSLKSRPSWSRIPEPQRNLTSPKYGSPQPRYSIDSKASVGSYKNMLKPVKNESEVSDGHVKEAYGATIETPEKSSVSNLHAMFDSQKSSPLMPMNSTNAGVRTSIGSPLAGDDRSVSSAVSASSASRPRPPVVTTWTQKQTAKRLQSPVSQEKKNPAWLKPRPMEDGVQASPVRSTASKSSQFSIASMMYSQNLNSQQRRNEVGAAMDWPTVSNEKPKPQEEDSLVVSDSITDVTPNDLELPSMVDSRPKDEQSVKSASSGVKPWENDTKHSIVQSWQNRASKGSSANKTEELPVSVGVEVELEDHQKTAEEAPKDQPQEIAAKTSDISYIEEKKSNDLSIDESEILGDRSLIGTKIGAEASQYGGSLYPHKENFYDDDSYISRGEDTTFLGLAASESMKTTSGRSRTLNAMSSEDMSVYVEDEGQKLQKEEKALSAQVEEMTLEVGQSGSKEDKEVAEANAPNLTIETNTPVKPPPNLPRLNPSPKDCDQYRNRYFEETGEQAARIRANKVTTPVRSKATEKQVIDIWASASTSREERDEAISFDETDKWLDYDPDIATEEPSESSNGEEPEPRPILIKKPREALVSPQKQMQRAKAMGGGSMKQQPKPQPPKQAVFDPFGPDAEEERGLTVDVTDDLFASNSDPFMSQESFSPVEWSGSPRSSNTSARSQHQQHIGYYHTSPDSRVEI